MDDNTRKEIVCELELDYERTTKAAALAAFGVVILLFALRRWISLLALRQGVATGQQHRNHHALLLCLPCAWRRRSPGEARLRGQDRITLFRPIRKSIRSSRLPTCATPARAWSSSWSAARYWRAPSPPASSLLFLKESRCVYHESRLHP